MYPASAIFHVVETYVRTEARAEHYHPTPPPARKSAALRATFRVGQVSVAAQDLKSPILVLANPADHVVDYRATRAFLRPAHADFIDVVRLPRSC